MRWLKRKHWWAFSELDYHFLITAHGKMGKTEKVKETMRSMEGSGFLPNVASYTSLMESYAERGLLYEAEGILNAMREDGPSPTALTYQTMIKAFVKVTIDCFLLALPP
jgi:pentatricopeptide repeat protein